MLPACPHLPPIRSGLDWQHLHVHRRGHRGAEFYFSCLEYAQSLWRQRRAARAILCLDRALGANLRGDEAILAEWPLPYAGLVWLLRHNPPGVFIGNPRVHFQNYAGRMNPPRREQRRWRAWACWALVRAVCPDLPGNPRHRTLEPAIGEIAQHLHHHGWPGEAARWRAVWATAAGQE